VKLSAPTQVLPNLRKGILCLTGRNFFGYPLWRTARASGADLLWRIKKNLILPCHKRLPGGSYLSRIHASPRDWRRGARIVLRGKTPELVEQEFYGLLMAHFAIRGLMHEAALKADEDPGRLSFLDAVRVVRRKLPRHAASSHFSSGGEAKCMRGLSVRGVRRLTSAGVLSQSVEHGEQAQRSNGGPLMCLARQPVRNAG